MEPTPELIEHLSLVLPDILAGSYPQTFPEVLDHFRRGLWGLAYGAHWLLTEQALTPHRAMVSVAVERGFRGKGLGLAMLEAAEAEAKSQGKIWLEGWLWEDNTAALAMDLRFGFKVVGRIEDAYRTAGGRSKTMLLVVKKL